jgi:hypothetical protein
LKGGKVAKACRPSLDTLSYPVHGAAFHRRFSAMEVLNIPAWSEALLRLHVI